tara:strand:+ start:329 stop:595 length:267 start_codon:yes stop_codon:yes gene_type:complete
MQARRDGTAQKAGVERRAVALPVAVPERTRHLAQRSLCVQDLQGGQEAPHRPHETHRDVALAVFELALGLPNQAELQQARADDGRLNR